MSLPSSLWQLYVENILWSMFPGITEESSHFWGVSSFYCWVKWGSETVCHVSLQIPSKGVELVPWVFCLPGDREQRHCTQAGFLPGQRVPFPAIIPLRYLLEIRVCWLFGSCSGEWRRRKQRRKASQVSFLHCRGEGDNLRRKQPKKQYNNSFTLKSLSHGI